MKKLGLYIITLLNIIVFSFSSCGQEVKIISEKDAHIDKFGSGNRFAIIENRSNSINSKTELRLEKLKNDIIQNNYKINKITFIPKFYGCEQDVGLSKVLDTYQQFTQYLKKLDNKIFIQYDRELRIVSRFCHIAEVNQKYWELIIIPELINPKGETIVYEWDY